MGGNIFMVHNYRFYVTECIYGTQGGFNGGRIFMVNLYLFSGGENFMCSKCQLYGSANIYGGEVPFRMVRKYFPGPRVLSVT